jgi:tellurite methyltransferase
MPVSQQLQAQFGDLDIYLFDQLLRGRFDTRRKILDAGCGGGRNLPFFTANGFEIAAIDSDPGAVGAVKRLAPHADARVGALDALPWDESSFDAVIVSAVLHFARDEAHFAAMVRETWRVLRPGGLYFARLATSIGIAHLLPAPSGRMRLPDGSARFVASEEMLRDLASKLGARPLDPLKTTVVENQRAMTTWVLEK